jgi:hypothetical protein
MQIGDRYEVYRRMLFYSSIMHAIPRLLHQWLARDTEYHDNGTRIQQKDR